MSAHIKAKVTTGVEYNRSRPPSPLKTLPTSASPTPGPRPRAKINSSAAIGTRKPASSPGGLTPTTRTNVAAPRPQVARAPSPFKPSSARAPSPFKPTQARAAVSVIAPAPKGRAGVRSNVSATATPSLPELRQRALTTTHADLSSNRRARRGSISSHISASPLGSRSGASPPRLALAASEDGTSGVSGHVRVKSKVSRLAEHPPPHIPQSMPSSPSFQTRPARVPSVSNLSLSPPLTHAVSGRIMANSPGNGASAHGRFATTQDPPAPKIAPLHTNPSRDDGAVNYSAHVLHTKVDPTSIPLPPYSPPVSTVSFSSRSSASKSSASYDTQSSDQSGSTAPNVTTRVNGMGHVRARSSIDVLSIQVSPPLAPREFLRDKWSPGLESDDDHDDYDNDNDDPERKRKNEAKSNRKIADLEITNKSLLAINSSLEAQKHRQAKEIRDLRRKLRESILVLPPRAYRAAKSSLTETGALVQDEELEDDEEDEEVDEVEEKEVLQGKNDESYRRVMTLLEALLESGRRALESKPEDFTGTGTGGAKVLSEEEARPWRGDDVDNLSLMESDRDDVSVYLAAGGPEDVRPISPSRIAIPDDDVDSEVEDETSLFVSEEDEFRRSSLPPITVTPSPSP